MAISTPQLVSCSARFEEAVAIRAKDTTIIFGFKNHKGSPLREVEIYKYSEIIDALSGPFFFNVRPVKIEILQQPFRFVSILVLTSIEDIELGEDVIVRFYYNPGGGRNTGRNLIYYVDYNATTNEQVGLVNSLSFNGIDPFIIDARSETNLERLYLAYITEEGQQAFRTSDNLGITWSKGCFFDNDVRWVEAYIKDPERAQEEIRALTSQSEQTTIETQGDAFINDFSLAPIPRPIIKRIYPFNRRPPRKSDIVRDLQRFRQVRPLLVRSKPLTDPC